MVSSTGWRDVASLVDPAWTVLSARAQRTGSLVAVMLAMRSTTATGTVPVLTLPTGWRTPVAVMTQLNSSVGARGSVLMSAGGITAYQVASSPWCFADLMFLTSDPWPTTLPGSPV